MAAQAGPRVMAMPKRDGDFAGTDVLSVAAGLIAARQPFALSVVIEAQGSTSARTGAKAIFDAEGTVMTGWVGGGCAESTIAHAALECLETETPQIVDVDLDDEVLGAGMPCGGRMRVYVEPVIPRPALWILGHGRVAECLCHLGALMSFDVTVDDTMAAPQRYPDATRVISDDGDYSALAAAAPAFVVIATQHRGDHESLRRLLATDAAYIALIASRKRTGLVLDYLREAGFQPEDIARIRAPAGIELGARTAEEIALSVIGEVVMVRRSRATARGKQNSTNAPATAPGERSHPVPLSMVGQRALRAMGA
jgi:xanthine dehydrogenase accessory factor